MQTILTGEPNDEMLERVKRALPMFFGTKVKIVISEDKGDGRQKGNGQKKAHSTNRQEDRSDDEERAS